MKLTIMLSAELKATLDTHAQVHHRMHQTSMDATALIPHMLTTFTGLFNQKMSSAKMHEISMKNQT